VNTKGVIVQTNQLLSNGIKAQFLKDGSQVLVRVLGKGADGKYQGSVAGVKISFTSNKPLIPGSQFTANVLVKDGIIQLQPKQNPSMPSSGQMLTLLQDGNLASLLSSIGLPADALSANLLQQLQQLEMKLDPAFLNKIRKLAIKFKGKEKLASQLLMILAEKGITAEQEELEHLLFQLFGDFEKKEENNKEDYSLLNTFNSKKGKWYFLPFEILNLDNSSLERTLENNILGKGCIKLLYNSDNSRLLMMNLNCSYNQKNFLFNMFFENNKASSLAVNIDSVKEKNQQQILQGLKGLFLKKNKSIDIFWEDKDKIEGSAASCEKLYSFEGQI